MSNNNHNSMEKIRVLCLHGYREDGESLKNKLCSFRKIVGKYVEFEFVDASHFVEKTNNSKEKQRSWWFNKTDGSFTGANKSGPAIEFGESVELVEKAWVNGNFQGLLGFNQGACFAALLCSLSQQGLSKIMPDFVVLLSGFKSGSLAHQNYYENIITIPSLHIREETDEIITPEMSADFEECFDESTRQTTIHPGSNCFIFSSEQKEEYINFFQDRLQEYLEAKEIERASKENTMIVESDSNHDSE